MYKIFSLFSIIAKVFENIFQAAALLFLVICLVFVLYMMLALANLPFLECLTPIVNYITAIPNFFWGEHLQGILVLELTAGLLCLAALYFAFDLLKRFAAYLVAKFKVMEQNSRNAEDEALNRSLRRDIKNLNNKIENCIIYYELTPKKVNGIIVDIEEQNRLFNQYLASKLSVIADKYGKGFIFNNVSFENLDKFFECFFKAISSAAPVTYSFIIQAVDGSFERAYSDIEYLRNTNLHNKILMNPTTNMRYEHSENKKYFTSVVGNYAFGTEYLSVYEVRDNYL